ncbi:MAG: DUF4340 domain-containing protein [Gammaproteobacteria bacterium]|nr:MAG: DUF4340 domain-containing protein [Gammaproteobacteria bacterium]
MTHHTRLNLVMTVTIIGLIVFLYFKPQSSGNTEYPLTSGSVEAAQHVRIVKQQQETVLKRRDGHWYLVKPVQAWADDEKIGKILEILRARSQQRFPLADLGRFGLERPHVQLSIDNARFDFGGFAPTTHQQYVATGDYVYLLAPRYALALPRNTSDLINPGLLAPDEIPVKFELPHGEVEFYDAHWRVTPQHADDALNAETLHHWVRLWQSARAVELKTAAELTANFAENGLITIDLRDERKIRLKILQNQFSIVLLRIEEGIGYQFPLEAGRQLLDPSVFSAANSAR